MQTDNFSNVLLSIIVILTSFLIARVSLISSLSNSFTWIFIGLLAIAILYLPFTKNSFMIFRISSKDYFKKTIRLFLIVFGVLYLLRFALFFLGGFYPSLFLLVGLGSFSLTFILTSLIVYVLQVSLNKFSTKNWTLFIAIVILISVIFFNFNAHLIPLTRAAQDPNDFFELTGQCSRLSPFYISSPDLSEFGCDDFLIFKTDGTPKKSYERVAPINAFRLCYYTDETTRGWNIIDCAKKDRYSDKDIFILRESNGIDVVRAKYLEEYGFKEDDSYFEVCKSILEDHLEEQKRECLNK